MRPFEEDRGRVRALYRIPNRPPTARVLELTVPSEPSPGSRWNDHVVVMGVLGVPSPVGHDYHDRVAGRVICLSPSELELPFRPASVGMVILHRTLDHLVGRARQTHRPFEPAAFLIRLTSLLREGGLLAGCVENRRSLRRLFGRLNASRLRAHDHAALPATFTERSCRSLLRQTGLARVEVLSLSPSSQSPSRLRGATLRSLIATARHELLPGGFRFGDLPSDLRGFARESLVARFFSEAFFFWGYKR